MRASGACTRVRRLSRFPDGAAANACHSCRENRIRIELERGYRQPGGRWKVRLPPPPPPASLTRPTDLSLVRDSIFTKKKKNKIGEAKSHA